MLTWQVPKVRSHWRQALIAMAACGMVACASQPPRSAEQKAADDATTQRVQAALAAAPNENFSKVTVSTYDGVVRLGGLVWSNGAIVTATRLASAVPGVTSVNNRLQLVSSQTPTH
jgi:osmotically-inducible protein OsmY